MPAERDEEQGPETIIRLEELCPSLQRLVDALRFEGRELAGADRELANSFCLELAAIPEHTLKKCFLETKVKVSKTPAVMDRILLFDSEMIDVRAHLFVAGAQETFIHNHGQSFISTCIEGSYIHKLWSIVDKENKHFVFKRKPGGLYEEEAEEHDGTLETILCQPFSAGQSLFISPCAQHTVESSTNGPLVTITIRNKRKRFDSIDILSNSRTIEAPTESVVPITDPDQMQEILSRFCKSLQRLSKTQISEPGDPYYKLIQVVVQTARAVDRLAASEDQKLTDYFNDLVLAVGTILQLGFGEESPHSNSQLVIRLKSLLKKLPCHYEYVPPVLRGYSNSIEDIHDLIRNLQSAFTGSSLIQFNHILFCLVYEERKEYFHPPTQAELMKHLNFPNVNPDQPPIERKELANRWLAGFLNDPTFTRSPATCEEKCCNKRSLCGLTFLITVHFYDLINQSRCAVRLTF